MVVGAGTFTGKRQSRERRSGLSSRTLREFALEGPMGRVPDGGAFRHVRGDTARGWALGIQGNIFKRPENAGGVEEEAAVGGQRRQSHGDVSADAQGGPRSASPSPAPCLSRGAPQEGMARHFAASRNPIATEKLLE